MKQREQTLRNVYKSLLCTSSSFLKLRSSPTISIRAPFQNGTKTQVDSENNTNLPNTATSTPKTTLSATGTCGGFGKSQKPGGKSLSRCGRCKTQLYCSTTCQKNDWISHKPICKTITIAHELYKKGWSKVTGTQAIDITKGVFITSYAAAVPGGYVSDLGAASNDDDKILKKPFTNVAISEAVGFPLRVRGTTIVNTQAPNKFYDSLFLDIDPASPSFGLPLEKRTGTALVERQDGAPLHMTHVKVLLEFCYMFSELVKDVKKKSTEAEMTFMMHGLAAELLNADFFKGYFAKMKMEEYEDNPRLWDGVDCPV